MYNKLFTKILDSSIWLEPDATRLVWITLLATMDEDGFCQYASVGNLARRAVVTLSRAEKAVGILEAPDRNSSDPDHEGRRIERVPGGWMVLNSKKYHDLATREHVRNQTRERVRKHRIVHAGEPTKRQLTLAELIDGQLGFCDCCHEPLEMPFNRYVVIDHDHISGRQRGAICQSCNKLVGLVESGKPVLSKKRSLCEVYCNRYVTVCNQNQTPSDTDTDTYSDLDTKQSVIGETPIILNEGEGAFDHEPFVQKIKSLYVRGCNSPGAEEACCQAVEAEAKERNCSHQEAADYIAARVEIISNLLRAHPKDVHRFWPSLYTFMHELKYRDPYTTFERGDSSGKRESSTGRIWKMLEKVDGELAAERGTGRDEDRGT